jgi:hypothetical protein
VPEKRAWLVRDLAGAVLDEEVAGIDSSAGPWLISFGDATDRCQAAAPTGAVSRRNANSSRLISSACVTHPTWGAPSIST